MERVSGLVRAEPEEAIQRALRPAWGSSNYRGSEPPPNGLQLKLRPAAAVDKTDRFPTTRTPHHDSFKRWLAGDILVVARSWLLDLLNDPCDAKAEELVYSEEHEDHKQD